MRIIAGAFKGRRLAPLPVAELRPTSDKLRETLFNVLAWRVAGADVLDGYAGTGALGLEALSRGATRVTFVDADRRAVALIQENLRRCGIVRENRDEEGSRGQMQPYAIICDNVRRALWTLRSHAFDLILLDPPYAEQGLEVTVAAAGERLAPDGWLVLEHGRQRTTPETIGVLRRRRVIASGDSALDIYERIDDAVGEAGEPRARRAEDTE